MSRITVYFISNREVFILSRYNNSIPGRVSDFEITDHFWSNMMEKVRTKVIPYQWKALNDQIQDADPSFCIKNFRVAAEITQKNLTAVEERKKAGSFNGEVFQDSDLAKWLEAVSYSLQTHPDDNLERIADEVIDLISAAQQPDGYFDTYYIINGLEKRFTNLKDNHELYVLGHMTEAAVAYYHATGKNKFLDVVIRAIECVDQHIGKEEGKIHGYPGHEILEMALVRLYEITKNPKHIKLAEYFINERGKSPLFFEQETKEHGNGFKWENSYFKYQYYQAGLPVKEQKKAEGHAVRAVYLYSGIADVAGITENEDLIKVCRGLWKNIVSRQMYITGGIGQQAYGEAFTYDYDLPNDTAYAETCASIGLAFFAKRMFRLDHDSQYIDVLERALFNGIISGMALDGRSFFYVNPLEVVPEACAKDHLRSHVKPQRQKWFACACCPPNIARLLTSIGSYIFMSDDSELYMNLYIAGRLNTKLASQNVSIVSKTNYPWDGKVSFTLELKEKVNFTLALRIPGWCNQYQINVNGKPASYELVKGYAKITETWTAGDVVELNMHMPVTVNVSNPKVRENIGRVAISRGPIVYCLEEADNGKDLHMISLGSDPSFRCEHTDDLDGCIVIYSNGRRIMNNFGEGELYAGKTETVYENQNLKWIPYYTWANRGIGEMLVWVHE